MVYKYNEFINENLLKGVSKNDAMDSLNKLEPYEQLSKYYEHGMIDLAKKAVKDVDYRNAVISRLEEFNAFTQMKKASMFGLTDFFIGLYDDFDSYNSSNIAKGFHSDMVKGAAQYGHYDIMKYLVGKKAINEKDLFHCVFNNHYEIVKLILDSDIEFHYIPYIKSAVYSAYNLKHTKILKLLLNSEKITKLLDEDKIKLYSEILTERLLTERLEDLKDTSDGVFWGNVGGGVLPICTQTKRILVAFRSEEVQEPHTWGVWGGKIDEDDGEVQSEVQTAVRREFTEETEYNGEMKLIPSYVFKTQDEAFVYYNFIGLLNGEFEPILDWENDGYQWITFDELIELEPKHFGLAKLMEEDLDTIKKHTT